MLEFTRREGIPLRAESPHICQDTSLIGTVHSGNANRTCPKRKIRYKNRTSSLSYRSNRHTLLSTNLKCPESELIVLPRGTGYVAFWIVPLSNKAYHVHKRYAPLLSAAPKVARRQAIVAERDHVSNLPGDSGKCCIAVALSPDKLRILLSVARFDELPRSCYCPLDLPLISHGRRSRDTGLMRICSYQVVTRDGCHKAVSSSCSGVQG